MSAAAAAAEVAEYVCLNCAAPLDDCRRKWCDAACRDAWLPDEEASAAVAAVAPSADLIVAVREALELNAAALDEQPAPSEARQAYRSVAFTFAAELRAKLADDLDADAAADMVEPVLELLAAADPHHEGGPWALVGEADIFDNPQDAEQDFLLVWDRLQPPAFGVAWRRAQESPRWADPTCLGRSLSAPRRAKFRAFVALAYELTRVSLERDGDGVVPLPVELVAAANPWIAGVKDAASPGASDGASTRRPFYAPALVDVPLPGNGPTRSSICLEDVPR